MFWQLSAYTTNDLLVITKPDVSQTIATENWNIVKDVQIRATLVDTEQVCLGSMSACNFEYSLCF